MDSRDWKHRQFGRRVGKERRRLQGKGDRGTKNQFSDPEKRLGVKLQRCGYGWIRGDLEICSKEKQQPNSTIFKDLCTDGERKGWKEGKKKKWEEVNRKESDEALQGEMAVA